MKVVNNKLIHAIEGSSGKVGEHYQLSFNRDKMFFVASDQLTQNTVVSHFKDSYSLLGERGVNKIYITLYTQNTSELDINVKLQEASLSKKKIIERIETPYLKTPKITSLLTLNNELVLVKGTYLYVTDKATMTGCIHPYFGILSANNNNALIQDNYALLRVLLIDGRYYFVTHFQKPESCSSGLVIYKLEDDGLAEAFLYYKDDLKYHKLS